MMKISVEEAYNMVESNNEIIILDVRTKEEYNEGHLKNAINIPVDIINTFEESNKDKEIIIYCRSGVRAGTAMNELHKMGYTNLYTFGGIQDWKYDIIVEE